MPTLRQIFRFTMPQERLDFNAAVSLPFRNGKLWSITCTDPVLGDSVTKTFSTFELAAAARKEFVTGLSVADTAYTDQGNPPGGFALIDRATPRKGQTGARRGKKHFDLNSVADVLYDHGLDPTVELAHILKPEPVLDPKTGNPVLNPDGTPKMSHKLTPSDHAKVLLELQQYVHPKLKAVEITQRTVEPTPEEVRAEIERLVEKAKAGSSRD